LLAIAHVLESEAETGVLDVEAVKEPSRLGGGSPTEINYVGADPWLVLLLNETRTRRYVVGVAAEGSILGAIGFPISELERAYLPSRSD
jgi:hypothetical protein